MHLLNYYTEGNVPEALPGAKRMESDQITDSRSFDASWPAIPASAGITFVPDSGKITFTATPC